MASGSPVVDIKLASPPGSSAATRGWVTGGSSPTEKVPVWLFDPTTQEYLDFQAGLYGYDGGGLTFKVYWSSGATTGDAVFKIAIRRIQDDAENITSSHTYSYKSVTATTASVAGEVDYATITFTNGEIDGALNNEYIWIRFTRDSTDGNDTLNSNDVQLHKVVGLET